MSKRYFNVVNPDDIVAKYGADCFRMYEMFLGPIEQSKPWDTKGIEGVQKFIRKFWSLFFDQGETIFSDAEATKEELKILHTCIKKVSSDIEKLSYNTCVSAFMVCVNELKKINSSKQVVLDSLVRLMAPFAPFITEELWQVLGNTPSVHHATFPEYNEKYLVQDSIEYPICINGKKRAMQSFDSGATNDEIQKIALEMEEVIKWIDGKND